MTDDEKWTFLGQTLDKMKEQDDRLTQAYRAVTLDISSPLVEPCHITQSLLVKSLEALIGDVWHNIEWYVMECNYGTEKREAGINGDMRPIETIEDLRWLCSIVTN